MITFHCKVELSGRSIAKPSGVVNGDLVSDKVKYYGE